MPAKKAPSANDTPNSSAEPNATLSASTSTARPKQLARTRMRHVVQYQRNEPLPDDQHQQQVCGELREGQAERTPDGVRVQKSAEPADYQLAVGRLTAEEWASAGKQNENKDHRQIFDDEPADDDTPAVGVDETPLLQRP